MNDKLSINQLKELKNYEVSFNGDDFNTSIYVTFNIKEALDQAMIAQPNKDITRIRFIGMNMK